MTAKAPKICPVHNTPLKRYKGKDVCEQCLFSAHLVHETQQAAVKRYNESPEGREAAKRYEQSEKGKIARNRYLRSDKYKKSRRAYNERLRESLAISRLGLTGADRAKSLTEPEIRVATTLESLVSEIRSFMDKYGGAPPARNVMATAKRDYNTVIDMKQASELITRASTRSSRPKKALP